MKLSTGVILTALGTVIVIVIANIIGTEYRIRREREEKKKLQIVDLELKGCDCSNAKTS